MLTFSSLISVIACFGCFAFTYEKTNFANPLERILGHITTGLLLLIIGFSIMVSQVLISMIIGPFLILDILLLLLYVACVGYDFWDLLRYHNKVKKL